MLTHLLQLWKRTWSTCTSQNRLRHQFKKERKTTQCFFARCHKFICPCQQTIARFYFAVTHFLQYNPDAHTCVPFSTSQEKTRKGKSTASFLQILKYLNRNETAPYPTTTAPTPNVTTSLKYIFYQHYGSVLHLKEKKNPSSVFIFGNTLRITVLCCSHTRSHCCFSSLMHIHDSMVNTKSIRYYTTLNLTIPKRCRLIREVSSVLPLLKEKKMERQCNCL